MSLKNVVGAQKAKSEFGAEVDAAIRELSTKTLRDIQAETALKWCARACAASILRRPSDAIEYAHEAVEHAALCGNDEVLRAVRGILKQAKVPV